MLLETEHLRLRPIQLADVSILVKLWSDPEVTRYIGGPRDTAYLEEQFESDARNPSPSPFELWPVVEKVSGHVVGYCGLLEKEIGGQQEIELIYVFARSAWGKGYATEIACALKRYAFEQLGVRRLVALIDPENTAAERVAAKADMHFEKETTRPGGKVMRLYAVHVEGERAGDPRRPRRSPDSPDR